MGCTQTAIDQPRIDVQVGENVRIKTKQKTETLRAGSHLPSASSIM